MRTLRFRCDTSLVAFLGAVVGPLLLFALLAYGVRDEGTFSWDRELVKYFDERYYELGTVRLVAKALVYLGIALGAVLAVVVFARLVAFRRRREALFWALVVLGALLITPALKSVFQRPEIGAANGDYSFPSGNAMASMALAVSVFLLLAPSRRRTILALVGVALVGLYGLALVLLLWHYPSDVVAGWCVSLAWVTGLWLVLRATSDRGAVGVFTAPGLVRAKRRLRKLRR